MEQYKPPPMIIDNPVDIPLPQSLTPSPPAREATPIIPAPWNRSPTPEEIPIPPPQPRVKKHLGPSSLNLIPLPWDIPPLQRITPRISPVASSSFLPEEPMPPPVKLPSQLPPKLRTSPPVIPTSFLPEEPMPIPVKPQSPPVTILGPVTNFPYFLPFYFALSVTRPSLVPSRAARTATKSPDKSPDGPHD